MEQKRKALVICVSSTSKDRCCTWRSGIQWFTFQPQCKFSEHQGPVLERLISINPGLKFFSVFVFQIPMH